MDKEKIKISCEATAEQFESAKTAVKLINTLCAKGEQPTQEQYGFVLAEVGNIINDRATISDDTKSKYSEMSELIEKLEDVCPPCMLSAYMVDAKSQLADLLALIDPSRIEADAKNIFRKFADINASLAIAGMIFSSIDTKQQED